MRFVDLHPSWDEHGILSFDCPTCPGRKVNVANHNIIGDRNNFVSMTITPSVRGTHHGPGRPCPLHVNIIKGQVWPAQ